MTFLLKDEISAWLIKYEKNQTPELPKKILPLKLKYKKKINETNIIKENSEKIFIEKKIVKIVNK